MIIEQGVTITTAEAGGVLVINVVVQLSERKGKQYVK
jgi:hypothetical protein